MNKRTKSFLLSILTLSFIFYSCSNLANDLQKRKNQNLFNITIQETSNGTVTAAKSSGIKAGEEVILSVTATTGYELKTIFVTNTQNKDVAVAAMEQGTSYKFTMPASDVTVGAAFDKTGPVDITEPGDLSGANGNTVYRIEHYQQDLDDTNSYTLYAIQKKKGNAGTDTAASAKDYPGFTSLSFTQKKIAPDGSTVVEIYYNRKTITYTFDPNGGNWDGSTEPVTVSGLYGGVVNTPDNPNGYGYFIFLGWDKAELQVFGSESQTVTACWDANANASYTLREYWQTGEGGNNYTLGNEYKRTGSVSTYTPVTKTGFEFKNIGEFQIDSNRDGFLNVYYDRKYYTVSFVTNGGTAIPDQQVLYETHLPQITTTKDGCTFYGWYYEPYCWDAFNGCIEDNTILYALWIDGSITYKFHDSVERLPAGTDGTFGTSGEYVYFGDYPQSLLSDNTITLGESINIHGYYYYEGNDGNLYYEYGSKYYKVEPIKWRVISRDENNIAVLLAENILDISEYGDYYYCNNFGDSTICSFLNEDFLETAFTGYANSQINNTKIIDSYAYYPTDIEVKIYLLSYRELFEPDYDSSFRPFPDNSSRIRTKTGFSVQKSLYNGGWWLRTTDYDFQYDLVSVISVSDMGDDSRAHKTEILGVVPALSIYLPPADSN